MWEARSSLFLAALLALSPALLPAAAASAAARAKDRAAVASRSWKSAESSEWTR
jgi:hypothetical protein